MEQLEYNHTKEIRFSDYLLDLQKLNERKLADLESLIHKYPYCQTLYLLATKAAQNSSAFNQKLTQAATILPDRTVLYHIIHHPEKLNKDYSSLEPEEEKEVTQEALVSIIQEDLSPENNLVETPTELKQETIDSHDEVSSPAAESFNHEDEVYEEIADVVLEHIIPTVNPVEEENDINLNVSTSSEMVVEEPSVEQEELPLSIDEEISTEDIETATPSVFEEEEKAAAAAEEEEEEENKEIKNTVIEVETLDQGIDYTVNQTIVDEVSVHTAALENEVKDTITQQEPVIENLEQEVQEEPVIHHQQEEIVSIAHHHQDVSKYNDERLPYTFLWWLAKTRKEYQNTQPYASFKLDTSKQIAVKEDVLSHQIAENIFHLRTVDDLAHQQSQTIPFDFRRKEYQIIERFIKEEPQIKPPPANKIDTENKAKRSSEDSHELVSETLAKVYVEQMLYHKALEVYKKLSLKYPEKSTYFASQIKYLELKVN